LAFIIPSNKILRFFFAALPLALALSLSYFRVFELYELQTYDWRCQLRGPRPVSNDIALIEIADDTLETIGQWPFGREYHAALIDVLRTAGAKAVLFDILFVEPSGSDGAVIQSVNSAKNVYFPTAFTDPKQTRSGFVSGGTLAALLPAYEQSAKGVGFVNIVADIDGKRRRIVPLIKYQDKNYFQFSIRAVMDILGIPLEKVSIQPGQSMNLATKLRLPLDDHGYFLVNYAGKWVKTFKHYSYADVLISYRQLQEKEKPIVDLAELKDKICFVGLTATASHDINATPLESIYPNVGIHANVLNSILNRDFIRRLDRFSNLLILFLIGLWVAVISTRLKPYQALQLTLLTLTVFLAGCVILFIGWGIWADVFYPFIVFVLIYSAATLGRVVMEMRKRELIESELKIASQIQKSFLPETLPQEKGLSVAVYMKSAKQVGGDLYTFLPLGNRKLGVMLGDVSGKGTPAALFMAKAVSEFKFFARGKTDPAEVLSNLNDSIASESTGGLFVTLTYAIFDAEHRRLFLSNGGHLPAVFVDTNGQSRLLEVEEGMPIGILPGVPFSKSDLEVNKGDCFAFYSDGVSEARNRKKEEYGVEALQKVMTRYRVLSVQEILNKAVLSLNQFMGKADQHDDITLVIVKIEDSQ